MSRRRCPRRANRGAASGSARNGKLTRLRRRQRRPEAHFSFLEVWGGLHARQGMADRKSTRLNSSHTVISYAVFSLKKKHYLVKFRRTALPTLAGLDRHQWHSPRG